MPYKFYDDLCSRNPTVKSLTYKPFTENVTLIPKELENTLYLVRLQADKEYLIRQGFGAAKSSEVLTVNEAQSLTFKHTDLIRKNPKPLLIYDKVEYSIIAVSRHTETFVYYTDVPVAALVGKIHYGFRPVNPIHKKSCLQIDEFIIDLTTLGGYRRLIKFRRFCRDHMPSSQLPEMSTFVKKVESSASVVIFREHLGNLNPNAFCQLRRI